MNDQIGANAFMHVRQFIERERRKRYSRPLSLKLIGTIVTLYPVVNYFVLSQLLQVHPANIGELLARLSFLQILLAVSPLVIGIGLLRVRRWALYSFIVYAAGLLIYNSVILIQYPSGYNVFAFVETLVFASFAIYYLRRDVNAPYIKLHPRGWRLQKRKPIEATVIVNDIELKTRDISLAGFYADCADAPWEPEDRVRVQLPEFRGMQTVSMGVVRVDANGAGFAFRDLPAESRKILEAAIKAHSRKHD